MTWVEHTKDTFPYFKSIQFLRAFAALYISLYHVSYWWDQQESLKGFFSRGSGAIDLFFVISGFVVFQSASRFKSGFRGWALFLKKRFIRIYPVYWVILLLFLATGFCSVEGLTGWSLLKTFLLLPGHITPITPSWTLVYELYFYVIISLYVLDKRWRFALVLLFLLSLAGMTGDILRVMKTGINIPVLGFFNEFVTEFFLGIIACRLFTKISFPLAVILCISGLLLFLFPVKVIPSHVLVFGLPSALLITGLTNLEYRQKIKVPRFIILSGDASYSLYLLHGPLLYYIFTQLAPVYADSRVFILSVVIIIALLAILFHLYIEKPLLLFLNKKLLKHGPSKKRENISGHTS